MLDTANKKFLMKAVVTGQEVEKINKTDLQNLAGFTSWTSAGSGSFTINYRPVNPRFYGKQAGTVSFVTPAAPANIKVSISSESIGRRGPKGDFTQKMLVYSVSGFKKDLFFSEISDNKRDPNGRLILTPYLNGAPLPQDLVDDTGHFVISLLDQDLSLNSDGTLVDKSIPLDDIDTSKQH